MLLSGAGSYSCIGAGGWQQAKQAEAWLRYLHVCPACPFSLLKLFVLSEEREEEIKNGDTSFAQVHELFVEPRLRLWCDTDGALCVVDPGPH